MTPTGQAEVLGDANRGARRGVRWKVFALLMFGALVGGEAVIPHGLAQQGRTLASLGPQLPAVLLGQALQVLVLAAMAAGLGLWLGPRIGLGAPVLRLLVSRDPEAPRRLRALLWPSIGLGAAAGVAIVLVAWLVLRPLVPELSAVSEAALESPPIRQGLLASFYGAINEEILLRLGLMTLLAWLGAAVFRSKPPHAAAVWTANALAAVVFGLSHLPSVAAVTPVTPALVVYVLPGNVIGGLVFGWLYWRRGLLSAMLAHFSADIVLHVITPAMVAVAARAW